MSELLHVTCALIEKDRKVLVAQRPPNKALGGKWEFPGGKIESGETSEACLIREINEELGCEIRICSNLTPVTHDYSKFSIRLIPFICSVVSGTPKALEHDAIQWCEFPELLKIDLADADVPIALEFLSRRDHTKYGTAS